MFKHGVWLGRTLGYAPSARAGAGAAWDATDKGVLVFDGYQGHKFTAIHDTWLYTNGSWKNIFSSSSHNNGPFGRVGAGVASAPPRGVVVFGGSGQRPIGGGITFVFAYSHWCSDYLSFYYGPHPDFGITVYYPGFAYDARDGYFVWFSHGQTWKFG